VTEPRRFSHAIADGEGISFVVVARDAGAETLAVNDDPAAVVRVVDFADAGASDPDVELALRVRDEEELEQALEELDPELLVLCGSLDHVLELLAEVPAGKLAIADVPSATDEEVEELERAGVDAVIVRGEA
jgi:indole-3-glycerol phosphate synthase